jgi:predicted AAA+ superfamily ATPase
MDGGYFQIQQELQARMREPAPSRIQVLTGPRQVGKTTLLLEIAAHFGDHAMYLAADAPQAILPDWWMKNWQLAIRLAQQGPAVLLVDEVAGMVDWSRQLKVAYDEIKRIRLPLHLVVSGSSSLQVSGGVRESMAGRFERLNLRHWTARDLIRAFDLAPEMAAETVVRSGAFPGGIPLQGTPRRWRTYLRDAIIEPAIGNDILMLHPVRKPALLRQVLAICLGHPSEIVSLQKIAGSLTEAGNLTTIADYLGLLEEAFLVAALPRFASSEIRRRAAPPKLVPLSNAFLAVASDDQPPTPATDPRTWGRWLENACLARAINDGHRVTYWREENLEVDMIVSGETGKWAIEVKSGDFTVRDLIGVSEFHRRHPDYQPLVIGDAAYRYAADQASLSFLPWQAYLLDGLPQ